MDALVYRKNTVPERQRALQADPRPVFQRLPRSRLYMGLFMTLFGVGMYGTTVGFYNMAVVRIPQPPPRCIDLSARTEAPLCSYVQSLTLLPPPIFTPFGDPLSQGKKRK
ncbi:hypothetical protein PaG_04937 [Moesziomyces aphidis]|uniref:Uncharacterized protein n=1 Tax=Moesziomyces aphidis TaxID=84754 RepID=W3VH67_MOEAP|nr:hypothetical protein PaG_04937 [Moesziomyces aphidis]